MQLTVRILTFMILGVLAKFIMFVVVPVDVLHHDIHGVSSYLDVLGALYGILLAFIIFVVWDQFSRVQIGISQEAAALEDLVRVGAFLSDSECGRDLRMAASRYADVTTRDEPGRLAQGETCRLADVRFSELSNQIRSIPAESAREVAVYEELLRALSRVSDARDQRLSVSMTRIPATLWRLILFASFGLFAGFLVLGIENVVVACFLVGIFSGMLSFLLSVVQDMDNPFAGNWIVKYGAMGALISRFA